jgi:hypothetical protein
MGKSAPDDSESIFVRVDRAVGQSALPRREGGPPSERNEAAVTPSESKGKRAFAVAGERKKRERRVVDGAANAEKADFTENASLFTSFFGTFFFFDT